MENFINKHANNILGFLSGFDRMIFRGCIREFMWEGWMAAYLNANRILLKDFGNHSTKQTAKIKAVIESNVAAQNRPFIYLLSNAGSKEKMAQDILEKDKIEEGLVCAFSVLEPCYSYKVLGNHATQKLEIKSRQTKCLHIYQYWNHPLYGLIHGRIQTWYPYNIQFYINGREFLKRQMDFKNISYRKADNAFLWISDLDKANKLAQKQVVFNWQKTFDDFALQVNPLLTESLPKGTNYYWTLAQSEWATDILFKDQKALENIYPDLVHYSMKTFNSPDVMKFLGKKLTIENWINGNFTGEVISDYKDRPEGCRVKHSVKSNSVKIYDKAGSVLRVETTINRPQEFKSYRPKLSTGDMAWQPMRKSIDDISRRAEVSDNINKRYLTALASANTERKFTSIVDAISEPITKNGYRVRGIDPFVKDRDILDIIINGKFHINGFRNRDIRKDLFGCQGIEQSKKDSAKVSRRLRILRTHGLIKKVTKTHRYMMTDRGIELISALKTIESTPVDTLLKMAA